MATVFDAGLFDAPAAFVGPAGELGELLSAADHSLTVGGDLRGSRAAYDHAYAVAELTGDADACAAAALGMAGLWLQAQATALNRAATVERLRNGLARIDPQSALAARIRVRLSAEDCYRRGDAESVHALIEDIRDLLDPVARAEALHLAAQCLFAPEQAALREELSGELLTTSFRTARYGDLVLGLLWQAVHRILVGDPAAGRLLVELRSRLEVQDHRAVRFVVHAIDVMQTIRAGDLDQAEAFARICADEGAAVGDVDAQSWYRAQLITIRWYQGRLAELLPELAAMPHLPELRTTDNTGFAVLAVAEALTGDRRRAAASLAGLRRDGFDSLPRSSSWFATLYGVIEAAFLLADTSAAEEAYRLLAPFADLPMVSSLGISCFGSAHHALGVAALTLDDLDGAVEHFRCAVQRNLALAHWPAVVASRRRHAEALMRRALPEDLVIAQRELATADDEAGALGLPQPSTPRAPEPRVSAAATRQGRNWQIELGFRVAQVEHSVGMAHLALLLANPGHEVAAVELAMGGDAQSAALASGSAQPTLDRTAVQNYRERLAALQIDIDEFEADNDLERAARARKERDWLLSELSGAVGLGGRTRQFTDGPERARIAVGKAIRRAIQRVRESDEVIGEHLRRSVHTGLRCSYRPA